MSTSKFRELWSPARQQIWPWRRSKVTVKVTTWYHRKGLVKRNTHAKYQSSICNSAKVMAKVKVFVTDGQTDRQRDGRMRFNVPTLSRKRGTTSEHCWKKNSGVQRARTSNLQIIVPCNALPTENRNFYDKRDDFNLHITNFLFLSSNIPYSPTYGGFI